MSLDLSSSSSSSETATWLDNSASRSLDLSRRLSSNSQFRCRIDSVDSTTVDHHSKSLKQEEESYMSTKVKYLKLTFLGLYITIFVSGIDQTVVSTILTRISSELHGLDKISWVPTVFMLCSTSANLVSGRMADVFGRLAVLESAIMAFVVGSLVGLFAQSMWMLILARGLGGIGCGGMVSVSIIMISDLVSIDRRGKYLGFLQICFGLSNAVGPLMGGALADSFSWRVTFGVCVAIGGIIALYMLFVARQPKKSHQKSAVTKANRFKNMDLLGIAVIIASISLLIVGLDMGGTMAAWEAPATIACLCVGSVLVGVFIYIELRIARQPLVPMWIFKERNVVTSFLVTFLCATAMFSIIFYMPLYFSAVHGASAMKAGLYVLPFGLSLSVSSMISGHFMSRNSAHHLLFMKMGPFIMAVGVLVLALRCAVSQVKAIEICLLLLIPGIGMGLVIVANVIAVQAVTHPRYLATVTPLCEFFLSIGGVLGVAAFGAVYGSRLTRLLDRLLQIYKDNKAAQKIVNEAHKNVGVIFDSGGKKVTETLKTQIIDAYVRSLRLAIWVLLPMLGVAFCVSLVLSKRELEKYQQTEQVSQEEEEELREV